MGYSLAPLPQCTIPKSPFGLGWRLSSEQNFLCDFQYLLQKLDLLVRRGWDSKMQISACGSPGVYCPNPHLLQTMKRIKNTKECN